MTHSRLLHMSQRWFRLLDRLYPPDFRDEMGVALTEAYMDRARDRLENGGKIRLAGLWLRALADALRNGPAERARPAASWRRGGNWGRDIELVRRRVSRSPLFAATTIGTLTIGLGMFAVVYAAVQKVLLDPMPYKNPEDLYYVWRDYGPINDVKRGALGGTDIVELQKTNAVIEAAAGLRPMYGGIFSLREGAEPMEIAVTQASPDLFQLLGVAPAVGRSFAPEEAGLGSGHSHTIVLTHHLWKRLGADPGIVGADVRLQGRPHTVVGVLPADFTFVRNDAAAPPQRVDAYIPIEDALAQTNPKFGGYAALIRGHRGASPEAVAAAVAAVGRAIDERDFSGRGLKLYPVGLKADVISRIRPTLVVAAAAGLVLLFMLMVNLASVLLARAAQRERELAVSRALGANTTAIVRATLLEGGLLGLAGGALGTLAAIWGARALVALAPLDLPRREAIAIDSSIGATVIAVGGLLGLLAAAAPAVWAARASLASLLAGSAVRGGGQGRWRRGMVVAQVALCLVLLASGALVLRSFERLLRTDPGFRPEGLFTMRLRVSSEFFPKQSEAFAFQDRVRHALAAIPGVTGASAASALPLTVAVPIQQTITIPGAPGNIGDAERDKVLIDWIDARANYVEVMGMRLRAGRTFTESLPKGMGEAIIDTALARRFFPEGNPLGWQIQIGNQPFTIIGVVDQARLYDVHVDGRPQILTRAENFGSRPLFYVMRTTREPHSLLPEVQAAIHRIDARVPVGEPRSMEDLVQASLSPQAMGGVLISAFAAGALLLAAMGIFGVVSGSVTRRQHELAVRLALGADHRRVLRLVLKEGALLVLAGLLIGAPGIYLAKGLIQGLLVGVSPYDPLTLLGAALGLLLVTMVACYVPARRALGIEPAQLLRQE